MRRIYGVVLTTVLLASAMGSCFKKEVILPKTPEFAAPKRRSFPMGFNPWPWDATPQAIDWTWDKLLSDGDIISHHLEQGVPWNEALNGNPFPASFQSVLQDGRTRAGTGKKSLLSLNSLNGDRSGLSPYRTEANNAPLPPPWNGYALNHANVKAAYLNFVKRVTDTMAPDFILTGIEANNLLSKQPKAVWLQFVELQCAVYNGLKAAGYKQPVAVSFVTQALYHPEVYANQYVYADQVQALPDIEPCVDMIAWSVHPFVSGLLAETFPDDYLQTIFSLTSKPQAISESSYPAQVWSMPGGSPTWNGSPEKQSLFVAKMLTAAQAKGLRYVIWFAPRDYDQLWNRPVAQGGLGQDTTGLVWRDTGLYDESGNPRPASAVWRQWLAQ